MKNAATIARQSPHPAIIVHRVAIASSAGRACPGASSGQNAGNISQRRAHRLAENAELIVDKAIANTLTSNNDKAAPATEFCCEANCRTKACMTSAQPGVAVAKTATAA